MIYSRCILILPKKITITPVTYKLSVRSKPPSEIRKRALQYVNKKYYNVVLRDSEHFATWCVYGKAVSANVKPAVAGGTAVGATAAGGGIGATIGGIVGSVVPGAGTLTGMAVGGLIGTSFGAGVGIGVTVGVTDAVTYDHVREEIVEFD